MPKDHAIDRSDLPVDPEASAAFGRIGGAMRIQTIELATKLAHERGQASVTREVLLEAFHQVCIDAFPKYFGAGE